jgi:dihydrolipoamide dehydrogenase
LHASHQLHEAEHNFAKMGLKGKAPSVDWKQMQAYKDDVIGQNTKGIEFLFKKNKIDWLKGWGSIPEAGKVKVGDEVHEAKAIVIASGSEPSALPGIEIDEKVVVTSEGALSLGKVPKKMVVIGAGVIGLELGSVYARLGSEVQVIEFLDHITPGMDAEVSKTFQRLLAKQGLSFTLGAAVQKVDATKTKAKVTYKLRKDDSEATIDADVVLVATGRKPYTDGLGLEALGVKMTDRGQVETDGHWATNVPGIYAIGDCIAGPMLAHKAEDEGMAVAEVIAGKHGHVNYGVIPGVIYTHPEVANVGETEETLKEAGPRLQGRQVLLHGQRAGQGQFRRRRLRQDPRRQGDRPHPRRAYHRADGGGPDPRDLRGNGIRRLGPGPGADLPRAPDLFGGRPRGGAGLRRRADPQLTARASSRPGPQAMIPR